ncbi:conserved hypothetical protein [Thiocapsa sp. KS1]|nr:membrane protein insertion efficiency factor YidD [Thiocapsa sp. KS1]CRI67828.1 conserved hypothetical protein [Thiocapsa sp. KS1]
MKRTLIQCIRLYQRQAPARLRACCRFEPSCSNYAIAALEILPLGKALWLIAQRLRRCRPPNGGRDELPGCHSQGAEP